MKYEERLFFHKLRVGKARKRDERWLRLRTWHWGCHSTLDAAPVLGGDHKFFFLFFSKKKGHCIHIA